MKHFFLPTAPGVYVKSVLAILRNLYIENDKILFVSVSGTLLEVFLAHAVLVQDGEEVQDRFGFLEFDVEREWSYFIFEVQVRWRSGGYDRERMTYGFEAKQSESLFGAPFAGNTIGKGRRDLD